jgi:hypothetical protein
MKNILRISIYLVLSAAFLVGCQDDETDNVSFVTTYPVITVEGPLLIIVPLGSSYTDAGAAAHVGSEETTVNTSGAVNVNEPGVYPITYRANNTDGFFRTARREVVVYDPATDAIDLSGEYEEGVTGAIVTVTKTGPSTYSIDDAAGFGTDPFLVATFVHTSGDELVIPFQATSSGITVETIPGSGAITATGFTWQLLASSTFGTRVRTFVKQ